MLLETRALLIPEKGLLRSLSEFTGFGSVILDQNFTILHISKEIKTLFQYEESDLVGRNCFSLCQDEEREAFQHYLSDLNHEGVSEGRIWAMATKYGRRIHCQVKGMWLETSAGEPLYLLSLTDTVLDEPPQKDWQTEAETCLLRETALYSSEERYRNLFEMAPDMILVHWPAHEYFLGEPMEVNQATCDRLGYNREKLLMGATPILFAEDRPKMEDIRKSLIEKKTLIFQIRLVAKEGEVIPFEFHSKYFETDGQPVILSVAREIKGKDPVVEMRSQVEHEFARYEIWNEKEALWRVDNDRELFGELVEVFFRAHADSVEKITQALTDKDYDTVTKLAHSFKGSAGNLSAIKIQKMAEYIEKNSRVQRELDIIAALPCLEVETDLFRNIMVEKGFVNES